MASSRAFKLRTYPARQFRGTLQSLLILHAEEFFAHEENVNSVALGKVSSRVLATG